MEFTFTAWNAFFKSTRTDKGYRIELDISPEDAKKLVGIEQMTGTFTAALVHNPESNAS